MPSPIKMSLKTEILPILVILLAFAFSFYFYAHFPNSVASHWNFYGQVDAYSGKISGAFSLPALLLGMYLLFIAVPFLDPRKERYVEFEKVYKFFRLGIMLVLFGVYLAMGFFNLGYNVHVNIVVPWLVGLLLIGIGNYMGKVKSNWFVGVRTPWTLSSENVWNKTNRFGGWAMVAFGVVIIVSPMLPKYLAISVFVLATFMATFGTMIYSYFLYRKEKGSVVV
jgi:uncharacterized membrane protein